MFSELGGALAPYVFSPYWFEQGSYGACDSGWAMVFAFSQKRRYNNIPPGSVEEAQSVDRKVFSPMVLC